MKAVGIRESLAAPGAGAILLALGALIPIGAALTGLCAVRENLAYASTAALAITALGVALSWRWARMVGRVVAWLNVALFDAGRTGLG